MSSRFKSGISFVIPVYNGFHTLLRCVNSIQRSNFSDYEIIIIDDGSDDGTDTIIKKLSSNPKVRSFKQSNQGVSCARNRGLNSAAKEYVYFIDCDDYLSSDFKSRELEILLQNTGLDVLVHGVTILYSKGTKRELTISSAEFNKGDLSTKLALLYNSGLFNYPVNKFWRKSFLLSHKIYFDTGHTIGEDFLFNIQAFTLDPATYYYDECGYIYDREVLSSATARFHSNYLESKIHQLDKFKELLSNLSSKVRVELYRKETQKVYSYVLHTYFKFEADKDEQKKVFHKIWNVLEMSRYLDNLRITRVSNFLLFIFRIFPKYIAYNILVLLFRINRFIFFRKVRSSLLFFVK